MTKIDKEISNKINKLLLNVIDTLENDIAEMEDSFAKDNLDKKKALVNILFKLASSITKLNQLHIEPLQQITNNLTIEDKRVINNYLKKLSSDERAN